MCCPEGSSLSRQAHLLAKVSGKFFASLFTSTAKSLPMLYARRFSPPAVSPGGLNSLPILSYRPQVPQFVNLSLELCRREIVSNVVNIEWKRAQNCQKIFLIDFKKGTPEAGFEPETSPFSAQCLTNKLSGLVL